MTIAVDFDGTIVEHRYPEIGKERPFAVETLKRLINDRHRLILWSVREGKLLDDAVEWCRARGLEFYAVNKDFPEETADALISSLKERNITPGNYRVLPCTGDKDIAYEAMKPMVEALSRRQEFFTPADLPGEGNLVWCVKENGWHTYDDCWEYLWLALPHLFTESH